MRNCFYRYSVVLLFTLCSLFRPVSGQTEGELPVIAGNTDNNTYLQPFHETEHAILFYNCENLFDFSDDPLKQDDEFTPQGSRHWTSYRQYEKLVGFAKVIVDAGEGKPISLIGLAEVENDSVLHRLVKGTALWRWDYSYVITRSDDVRGVNVALLYQPTDFRLLGWEALKIPLPKGSRPTRDLLHAWGRVVGGDTLDVVVCHLPSRLGGTRFSAPKRSAAHRTISQLCDSLDQIRLHPHVLVMGDMNDSPDTRLLRRNMQFGNGLYNLMDSLQSDLFRLKRSIGTHKYQGQWSILDQFWVNQALLPEEKTIRNQPQQADSFSLCRLWVDSVRIICYPYLLVEDYTHLGHRPKRSYYGYQYEGGFSDHLPIRLNLHVRYR